jgi:hypothetical protein
MIKLYLFFLRAEQELNKLEQSRHNINYDNVENLKKNEEIMEDPLSFNDLDKEWELMNTALSNLNDKYRENLSFLQK